jgi:hypothetical protein
MTDIAIEKGTTDMYELPPQMKSRSNSVERGSMHPSDRHSKKKLEQLDELVRTELSVVELSDAEKNRVLRKADWILVPQLALLYLLSFLDRGNSTRYLHLSA